MISTVNISRTSTTQVAVEHPAEWTPEQVATAVKNRAIDIAQSACMWIAENRTTITGIEYDMEPPETEAEYAPSAPPVTLTDEDL